jgi:hypothetical protein
MSCSYWAETAIGHARKAEEIMLRGDGHSDIIREIAALGARHLMRAFAWSSSAGLAEPRAIVAYVTTGTACSQIVDVQFGSSFA